MKIEVEKLLAIIELMHIDSLKKITITTDATGVHFDNEAFSVHVKLPVVKLQEWSWNAHDGSNYTPASAMSCSIIEVVANGDTREQSHSMHPSNVKWNNIKEWRRTK